jgi:hypothetical protein
MQMQCVPSNLDQVSRCTLGKVGQKHTFPEVFKVGGKIRIRVQGQTLPVQRKCYALLWVNLPACINNYK